MNTNDQIPMPPRRWMLRFGLPVLVLATAVVLLLGTMWSMIMPARTVRTASALVRNVDVAATSSNAIVQAPGYFGPTGQHSRDDEMDQSVGYEQQAQQRELQPVQQRAWVHLEVPVGGLGGDSVVSHFIQTLGYPSKFPGYMTVPAPPRHP